MSRDDTRPTATLVSADGAHLLAQRFELEVTAGPDRGLRHVSTGERVVIGSHRSADLVLTDQTVSRFHVELVVDPHGVAARDLGSRNGTRIDGLLVRDAVLAGHASLELGKTHVRLTPDRAQVKIPLSPRDRLGGMVGRSGAIRAVFALLESAARSDATVLLEGETGTGKEVAAEAIHRESARAEQPFVVVDCASLPAPLLEAELFGHLRGAFTGADADRTGAFEEAAGGTVFLDEIGELPLELQPKLLRVLETKRVSRVGSSQSTQIDFRVVAATNRNLRQLVNGRRFRPDLYYRLAILPVRLPPLRERADDIPLLVASFLDDLGAGEAPRQRVREAMVDLLEHSWPGNVRELRNHVERLVTLDDAPFPADGAPVAAEGPPIDANMPLREARERHVAWFERRYLEELLRAHGGVVAAAARTAGVARVHLHRMLSRARLR